MTMHFTPGSARVVDDRASALHVNAFERLVADLAVDPRTMRHGIAAGERGRERVDVVDRDASAPGDNDGLSRVETFCQMAADEAGAACDGNLHDACPFKTTLTVVVGPR